MKVKVSEQYKLVAFINKEGYIVVCCAWGQIEEFLRHCNSNFLELLL